MYHTTNATRLQHNAHICYNSHTYYAYKHDIRNTHDTHQTKNFLFKFLHDSAKTLNRELLL